MKLRFVKFFTSRENEIEKKEEGGRRSNISCLAVTQLGRSQSPRSRSPLLFSSSLHHSILPPSTRPHQPTSSVAPACRPPRSGRAIFSSYPSPAIPLLSSFFIKLPKRKSVERRTVAEHPASRPSCNRARPARRTLAPVLRLSSTVFAFFRL